MIAAVILATLAGAVLRAAQDTATAAETVTADVLVERAKALDVRTLDPALPSMPLERWLRDIAGDSSVKWEVNDCGEQTGDPARDRGRVFPACVEATITLAPARSASVSIVAGSWRDGRILPGQPALWHSVVVSGGTPAFVNTLGALRQAVAAAPSGKESPLTAMRVDAAPFARYFPSYTAGASRDIPVAARRVSPLGSRVLATVELSPSGTPYEDVLAAVVVQEGDRPLGTYDLRGYKNLGVEWVTEDVIKFEVWPGPGNRLVLVALVDAADGRILHRAAFRYVTPADSSR